MDRKERMSVWRELVRAFNLLVHGLARSRLKPLSRPILAGIRFHRRDQVVEPNRAPTPHPEAPSGPCLTRRNADMGDLLLFVPRSIESHLVDFATGGYGYSHVAVDCGEVDLPSGQPVMIESTVRNPVWRSRQDRYGQRPYARIHLREVGIDPADFCKCVLSHLGEHYDDLEALTWGAVDDPAKQICSDLAADCLPTEVLLGMAQACQSGTLRRNSVSINQHRSGRQAVFVSPNGFAQYFGAPPGIKIKVPGERVIPSQGRKVSIISRKLYRRSSMVGRFLVGIAGAALVAWTLARLARIERKPAAGMIYHQFLLPKEVHQTQTGTDHFPGQ